jgi:hypothetical protein
MRFGGGSSRGKGDTVKRILIGSGAIVTLVFAAVAFAGVRHYHGSVKGGGDLNFVTKVRNGDAFKVKRFVFKRVPMKCDDGASTVGDAGSPPPPMRIKDENRFRGKFTSPSGRKHLRIRGRLTDGEQRAHGKLRVFGDFGGSSTNCHTGKVRWRARHGT